MSNLNKHPNNFFENWKSSKKNLFQDVLISHLKNYDQDRIVKAIIFERKQFPRNIQKEFNFEKSSFWKGIDTALEDPDYLSRVTVVEAFQFFLKVAKDKIKYFKKYDEKNFNLNQQNKNELFSLYQMSLLHLVGQLHSNKEFRKNAKIKDREIAQRVNPFKYFRLWLRTGRRFSAFVRFLKEGYSETEARRKVDNLYAPISDDYLFERGLIKLNFSWLAPVILIFIAWYTNN